VTAVDEWGDSADVASALRSLAGAAGDRALPSDDPRLDPTKDELRTRVADERRPLFDLFAPRSGALPEPRRAAEVAEALAAAARRVDPEGDPGPALAGVRRPVHVLHGRYDRLIPFSEALRLSAALPTRARVRATITRLFGHSGEHTRPSVLRGLTELPRFLAALRGVLRVV
jgi:pimeloyl-ACP methyl ester carboxylesterase